MHLPDLAGILAPPIGPANAPNSIDWRDFEAKFARLPEDIKAFLSLYGTGAVDDFIWIFSPVSTNSNLNLGAQIEKQLGVFHEAFSQETLKFPLFPQEGGIVPVGITENGDVLFSSVQVSTDAPFVLLAAPRAASYEIFRMPFTEFLAGVLTRRLRE